MIGCAGHQVTKIEVVKQYPPKVFLIPIVEPKAPTLPDGQMVIEDVINFYEGWITELQKVFRLSEMDKARIREWVGGESE